MRHELGEVLRRGVGEDHALSGETREADVRERGERLSALAHSLDRPERGLQADAVIRADRRDVERCERARRLLRRHAAERLRVLVEREQADDRKRRDCAHRVNRGEQLGELVERLDHEQVDAASFQKARLLGEDGVAVLGRPPSGPIEPAMNTSAPEISRASRAIFTAASLIAATSSSR